MPLVATSAGQKTRAFGLGGWQVITCKIFPQLHPSSLASYPKDLTAAHNGATHQELSVPTYGSTCTPPIQTITILDSMGPWFIFSHIYEFIVCFKYACMYVCVWVHVWHSIHVEVRGQLSGIGSLLQPCGSWGSNSGCQVW